MYGGICIKICAGFHVAAPESEASKGIHELLMRQSIFSSSRVFHTSFEFERSFVLLLIPFIHDHRGNLLSHYKMSMLGDP